MRTERVTAQHDGQLAEARDGVIDHRDQVVGLALAVVVLAFGVADAAEVGAQRDVAEFGEGARQRLGHLVVERAAVDGVGMRHQRDAARCVDIGMVDDDLDATCGTGDEYMLGVTAQQTLAGSRTHGCTSGAGRVDRNNGDRRGGLPYCSSAMP